MATIDLANGAHWQLQNLTAQDVRNLAAALDVAYEDGDHGMNGVDETRAKVRGLVDALRSAGVELSTPQPTETNTWTAHLGGPCRSCGRKFRVTQESIDLARAGGEEGTDEQLAASLDFCLSCVGDVDHPEEHDTPETQARALAALSPAEAAPLVACMIAAEWQTQQNIIGLGDHDVPDFAKVHEHVDGNMLGYETVERLLGPGVPTDRVIDYVSAAHQIVDEYLRLRHTANA